MPRYTDVDALMKEFSDFVRRSNNSDLAPVPNWNDAVSIVGSAPTVEVIDRKKGKWIEEVGMLMCSECGDAWGTEQFEEVMSFNYCPNCGARMKGEDDALEH